MEYEDGSVLDPYLFSGRPKKPNPGEQFRPKYYNKPKPVVVPVTRSVEGITGIFKTFKKVTSPEYQLQKTNRQIKTYETKEKLLEARQRFAEKKAAYDEAHPSFFHKLMNRSDKSIYTKKREISLPKGGE